MLNHLGTVTLETERLILRRAVREDADAMFRNWSNDSEVTKFLTWAPHASPEVSLGYINYLLSEYERNDGYAWVIVLKNESPEPVGMISVVKTDENTDCVQIGYCLGRKHWGKGVMTEAMGRVIRFFIEDVGAKRVEARHDARNTASGAVMKKCGMTYEGTLRRADRNNQGVCDSVFYSILAEELK